MAKKHTVFLLLGSNIHPRTGYLKDAINIIDSSLGVVKSVSSLYESEPWGFEAPVTFLNQVVCLETSWEPLDILKKTQEIERQLGRSEKSAGNKYVSRTLDIDILFFDNLTIRHPELIVPHAQITNRRFALMPIVEMVPEKKHPVFQKTCRQLLEDCTDACKVWKYKGESVHAL